MNSKKNYEYSRIYGWGFLALCKLFHFADCGGRLRVYRVHLLWDLHRLHLPGHTLHAGAEPHDVPDQHVGRGGNLLDE